MVRLARALLIAFVLMPLQTRAENVSVMIHGVGTASCAKWLSSQQMESEGTAWFFGFWTGMNWEMASLETPGNVGHSTDAYGLLGELKKRCADIPSSSLINEAGQLFILFRKSGR